MSRAQPTEEGGRTIRLAWDLDLDIGDTSTSLTLPVTTDLAGKWSLHVRIAYDQSIRLTLQHEATTVGILGSPCRISFGFGWIDDRRTQRWIQGGERFFLLPLPSREDGTLMELAITHQMVEGAEVTYPQFSASHRHFFCSCTVTDLAKAVPPAPKPSILPEELARAVAPSTFTRRPNNVRLFFPRIGAGLWASSSMLSTASPYWKTLLESDFQENVQRGRKRPRIEGADLGDGARDLARMFREMTEAPLGTGVGDMKEEPVEGEGDDSDEETDDWVKRTRPPTLEADEDEDDLSYRQVTITETAYSTYRAVLLYLTTSHIAFSPLTSSLLPLSPSGTRTRSDHRDMILASEPLLPPPVSPKSVYALAHLLEIPSLVDYSLATIKSGITVENAATELFSNSSVLYDGVRTVLLDFVVEKWEEVKVTEGMKKVDAMAEAGELPRSAGVYAQLLRRLR